MVKASDLISALQGDIAVFGDQEIAFSCDDLDEPIWIDGVGVYVKENNKRFILLVCGECHHRAMGEKHQFEDEA